MAKNAGVYKEAYNLLFRLCQNTLSKAYLVEEYADNEILLDQLKKILGLKIEVDLAKYAYDDSTVNEEKKEEEIPSLSLKRKSEVSIDCLEAEIKAA